MRTLRFTMIAAAIMIIATLLFFAAPTVTTVHAGTAQTYLVLYNAQAVPADAATIITNAGGTLVYSYDAIGVAIARSDNPSFRDNLLKDSRVNGAAPTAGFATQIENDTDTDGTGMTPNTPAPGNDNLSGLQWDMDQISAPQALRNQRGQPFGRGRRHRYRSGLHPP